MHKDIDSSSEFYNILTIVDSIPNSHYGPSIIVTFLSYKSLNTWMGDVGDIWLNKFAPKNNFIYLKF